MLLELWTMDIDTSAVFAPGAINDHTVKHRLSVAAVMHLYDPGWPGDRDDDPLRPTFRVGRLRCGRHRRHLHGSGALAGLRPSTGLTGGVRAHAWNPVVSGIKANSALVIALMMHVGALGLHALKAASVTQQGRDHARLYCRHHGSAIAPA